MTDPRDEDTLDSADQRLVHGLLSALYEKGGEARIRNTATREAGPRPMLARVAALFAFAFAGIMLGLALQAEVPEAEAVVDRAVRTSWVEVDRLYEVRIEGLRPDGRKTHLKGNLHTRGERLAMEFDSTFGAGGSGWFGTDGVTTWLVDAKGRVTRWKPDASDRSRERERLSYARFDDLLKVFGENFDLATVGVKEGLIHVRATRKMDAVNEARSRADLWVSEKTGVIQRLEVRSDPRIWHWDPWVTTFEYRGEEPVPDSFYNPEGH